VSSLAKLAATAFGRGGQENPRAAINDAAAILETSDRPMIIVDGDSNKIIQANAAAYALFGAPLVSASLDTIIPEPLQLAHKEHQNDYMQVPVARPMGVGIEVQAIAKGSGIPVEIGLTPIPTTRLIIAGIDPLDSN
jgi:PAS domain S-box-containing protein